MTSVIASGIEKSVAATIAATITPCIHRVDHNALHTVYFLVGAHSFVCASIHYAIDTANDHYQYMYAE